MKLKWAWFGGSGRGHAKIFGALCVHYLKRTPLFKFLDPPLIVLSIAALMCHSVYSNYPLYYSNQ